MGVVVLGGAFGFQDVQASSLDPVTAPGGIEFPATGGCGRRSRCR
jgi:hypothetical protein